MHGTARYAADTRRQRSGGIRCKKMAAMFSSFRSCKSPGVIKKSDSQFHDRSPITSSTVGNLPVVSADFCIMLAGVFCRRYGRPMVLVPYRKKIWYAAISYSVHKVKYHSLMFSVKSVLLFIVLFSLDIIAATFVYFCYAHINYNMQ